MKQLPGFHYDARKRRASFDGFVRGTGGKVRRRKTVDNVTRDQALVHWKTFRAELESGRAIDGPVTLSQFVHRFYGAISAGHQQSTRLTQQTIIRNHLLRFFGTTKLEAITPIHVADLVADMRSRRLSPAYINNSIRVLKMLLRQAVERDVIADYPLKKKIPKEKEKPLRLELTRDERTRFFATFEDEDAFRQHLAMKRKLGPVAPSANFTKPRRFGGGLRGDSKAAGVCFARFQELRDFFVVAIESGLRKSDLRDLRFAQIDFHAGFIRVLMQKTTLEAEIPLSRACREALLRAQEKHGGEYVFVDANGCRYSQTRIRRTFVLAKKLAGITRRLRPHDLRHSYASRLATASVSLQVIAKSLGHTSIRMSERYARPSEEAMRVVTSALDADPVVIPQR